MWLPPGNVEKEDIHGLVAVAVDKDKGSQYALKWAIDHLIKKGHTVILIHVKLKSTGAASSQSLSAPRVNHFSGDLENSLICTDRDPQTKEVFIPFRVFCTRKDIHCKDVVLEDADVAKALIEYVSHAAIEHLVVGSPSKSGLLKRFQWIDIPGAVSKGAPDFCAVYVVSKGKLQSMRSASCPALTVSPLRNQLMSQSSTRIEQPAEPHISQPSSCRGYDRRSHERPRRIPDETDSVRSPFNRRGGITGKSCGELCLLDVDISFVSSGRQNTNRLFPSLCNDNSDTMKVTTSPSFGLSDVDSSTSSFESMHYGSRSLDIPNSNQEFSSASQESDRTSTSSQPMDEVEAEIRRLKLELKQTMEMYSAACKEALNAKQKAVELQRWKIVEERRLEEARLAQEAALAIVEKEKAKSKAALEAAEANRRIAELEAQKRINAEKKALREAEEKKKPLNSLTHKDVIRYRRYTIEEIEAATENFASSRKIGEGGYGPVYKCHLDHTPVAVKVLRPDAAHGQSQFQQEVEVLSCIRHPNMVLLLGACPEYGCLVYEYMAHGSLEDRLMRRGNSPPLSWQLRFKIAAEIGTGLLFLHQTKPEPLVHRDLKPGNILLDSNYVAKISDVGLARLVPPSVAESVTQYRMTATAGTFCYIDPEYQQTGMLGVKSDIYSLGIMFLQIITAKPPMGLTHHVERSIEKGKFSQLLDPAVTDWPVEEALNFAKLSLRCAELRRKDRPDLSKAILPEFDRLRDLAESSMYNDAYSCGNSSPSSSYFSTTCKFGTAFYMINHFLNILSKNKNETILSSIALFTGRN